MAYYIRLINNFFTNDTTKLSFSSTKELSAEEYKYLARHYKSRNLLKKVIECYEKALDLRTLSLGFMHKKTANSYNDLATAYFDDGLFERAILFYEKALLIRKSLFGEGHA